MNVGFGLYMYDVVVKRSLLLSQLLMSSCFISRRLSLLRPEAAPPLSYVSLRV